MPPWRAAVPTIGRVSLAPEGYLYLGLVVLVAAFLNGAAGYGFAVVAVAGFAFVLDPKVGIIVMSLITPILTTLQLRRHWPFRGITARLRVLLGAALVGSAVGTQFLIILPSFVLSIFLGLFALWYAVSSIRRGPMHLAPERERLAAPGVGFIAGIVNGTVGASGPVLGSYLLAIGLKSREWIFAISIVFWSMSFVRITTLAIAGQYRLEIVLLSFALAAPAFVAQAGGFAVQTRFSPETFQRIVLLILFVASANLLWRGFGQAIAAL